MEAVLNKKRIVHFPNLTGLRFFAAFVVLVHHVEQYRSIYGYTNYWGNPAILYLGEQGVTLFFVLSGFLITYLLLAEKEKFGQIAVRQFYIRRALRIWPLYFAVVLLSLLILPRIHFFDIPGWTQGIYTNFKKKVFLFGFVLPNLALSLYGIVPYLAQSWSIGTEEQFYLVWPWVVQKSKRPLLVFLSLGVIYSFFKYSIGFIFVHNPNVFFRLLHDFLYWFRVESMFIGSVFAALLFFEYKSILQILMSQAMQLVVSVLIIGLIIHGNPIALNSEVYSILFGLLILNLAASPKSIIKLENPVFNFLGRISYGLYMFQSIAIVIAVRLIELPYFRALSTPLTHFINLAVSLILLIALASLSYSYLEKPFLKSKSKFMLIKSSN